MHASLALILTTATLAFAQTSSAPDSSPTDDEIPPCVLQCLTTAAASNGCSSFDDLSCVCTSTAFLTAATSCIGGSCSPDDLASALQLQQDNCGDTGSGSSGASSDASTFSSTAGSGTSTGSSTRPVTSGATTSGASTSFSAGSQSSSPSSGGKVALFGKSGLVAGFVAAGGAVVGGLLL